MKYCRKCGEHYRENFRFCTRDGKALDTIGGKSGEESPDPSGGGAENDPPPATAVEKSEAITDRLMSTDRVEFHLKRGRGVLR